MLARACLTLSNAVMVSSVHSGASEGALGPLEERV